MNFEQGELFDALAVIFESEVKRRGREFQLAPMESYLRMASSWLIKGEKTGLLIYGSVGNGKTTLLRTIFLALSLFAPIFASRRIYTAELLLEIAKGDWSAFEEIKNSKRMLFIDDLGVEPVTAKSYGNSLSPLTSLIAHRYSYNLGVVMTSNLLLEEIADRYDERIADRIIEQYDLLYFKGESFRKQKLMK